MRNFLIKNVKNIHYAKRLRSSASILNYHLRKSDKVNLPPSPSVGRRGFERSYSLKGKAYGKSIDAP
jgi:hypothetical protein